jgi:hypothetical protein
MSDQNLDWLVRYAEALRSDGRNQDAQAVEEYVDKIDHILNFMAVDPAPIGGLFERIALAMLIAGMLTVE